MAKKRRPRGKPAHDTPVMGPRKRASKPKPLPPSARRRRDYDPGVPDVRDRDPWVDAGTPEPNG